MITASATLQGVISATAQFMAVQSGGCADATVENSDVSYSQTVASGATLVLTDTTYEFKINNVLQTSVTVPSQVDYTFNVSFN